MGQRLIRVNELIKREVSDILHTAYQSESVAITITRVDVVSDLRHARVYYAVIGEPVKRRAVGRFLSRVSLDVRKRLSKRIVLKYLPVLEFVFDPAAEGAFEMINKLDELD